MKVLQVIDCFTRSGGAEKFVFDLSLALKAQGIQVEVLSVIPVKCNDFKNSLEEAGIPVHILTTGKLRSMNNFRLLRRFLKEHSYDIVHAHLFPVLYFVGLSRLSGQKILYTEHSTDNRRRHFLFFKVLDRIVYRRYDKICCISEAVEEMLLRHTGKINTVIIPNGIKMGDFFQAKPYKIEELGLAGDVKIIVMSARFVKGKDYLTLFRALDFLPDNVHVLCVGSGELETEHRSYCIVNKLSERIHFLGLRSDVNRILKTSDVIVLSTEHEGFSLSMLEAMSSGRPLVASEVPGIVDLIKDYAVLFPFGKEKALADCIKRLLEDGKYRDAVVEKSLQFAKRFDIAGCAGKYVETYQEIL